MRRSIAAVILVLATLAGCTTAFFQPHRQRILTPGQFGLAHEDISFKAADGVELFGWFLPAKGKATGTILFLHGNAENISTHIAGVAWLPERGFNVLLIDYRGYGASEGTPSLEGSLRDIDAALRVLLARSDIDQDRIVVYGQSLGGSLAVYHVAHSPWRSHIRALIVESAFSSYAGIAREKLASTWFTWLIQWLPSLTVDERFSPLPVVPLVSPIPLLVIHGDRDAIVAVHHGERLYAAARDPKQLWIVSGAGHIQAMREEAWRDRLTVYLREVLK